MRARGRGGVLGRGGSGGAGAGQGPVAHRGVVSRLLGQVMIAVMTRMMIMMNDDDENDNIQCHSKMSFSRLIVASFYDLRISELVMMMMMMIQLRVRV